MATIADEPIGSGRYILRIGRTEDINSDALDGAEAQGPLVLASPVSAFSGVSASAVSSAAVTDVLHDGFTSALGPGPSISVPSTVPRARMVSERLVIPTSDSVSSGRLVALSAVSSGAVTDDLDGGATSDLASGPSMVVQFRVPRPRVVSEGLVISPSESVSGCLVAASSAVSSGAVTDALYGGATSDLASGPSMVVQSDVPRPRVVSEGLVISPSVSISSGTLDTVATSTDELTALIAADSAISGRAGV